MIEKIESRFNPENLLILSSRFGQLIRVGQLIKVRTILIILFLYTIHVAIRDKTEFPPVLFRILPRHQACLLLQHPAYLP